MDRRTFLRGLLGGIILAASPALALVPSGPVTTIYGGTPADSLSLEELEDVEADYMRRRRRRRRRRRWRYRSRRRRWRYARRRRRSRSRSRSRRRRRAVYQSPPRRAAARAKPSARPWSDPRPASTPRPKLQFN